MSEARKPRRLTGCLARGVLVAFVTSVVLYATRARTVFPVLADLAERYAAAYLDADLVIEGLGGDGWSTLTATRLELRAHDGATSPLRQVAARELELELAPTKLLRGDPRGLRAVRAAAILVEVDAQAPAAEDTDEPAGAFDPDALPEVWVGSLSGAVELGGDRRILVRGGAVSLTPGPAGPTFKLGGVEADLRLLAGAPAYTARLDAEALLTPEAARVARAQLIGDQLQLTATDVRVPFGAEDLESALRMTRAELDVRIEGLLARLGARRPTRSSVLTARARVQGGAVVLEDARLEGAGGSVRAREGRLTRDAEGKLRWTLSLRCDVPRVETLEGLLGSAGWSGAMAGSAQVQGVGLAATLALEASAEQLELADVRLGSGTLIGSASLRLDRPQAVTGDAELSASPAWIAGREFEALTGEVELASDELRIRALHATQPGNVLDVPELTLPRSPDPAALLAGAAGELRVEVSNLQALALGDALPPHALRVSARVADRVATLEELRLEVAGGILALDRGSLRLARSRAEVLLDVAADVDFPDLAPVGELLGEPELAGALVGRVRGFGTLESPKLALDLDARNVVARGTEILNAGLEGELGTDSLRIDRLHAESPHAALDAAGELNLAGEAIAGRLDELRLSRDDRSLGLDAPFAFSFDGTRASIEPFTLAGTAGALELRLDGDGERWSAEAVARDLDLNEVLPENGLGRADGLLAIERSGDDLRAAIDLSLSDWAVPGFDGLVAAEIDVEQVGTRLDVNELTVASSDGVTASLAGTAPIDWTALDSPAGPLADGELRLRATSNEFPLARLHLPEPWDSIGYEGVADVELDLTGSWAAPRGAIGVDVDGLRWTGPRDLALGEFFCDLSLTDDGVRASLQTVQPARFHATGVARVGHAPNARAILQGELAPLVESAFGMELDVRSDDLAWLPVRVAGLRRSAGAVSANLEVRGSLVEPRWVGDVTVAGGELKLDSEIPSLVDLHGALRLDGRTLELVDLTAELGGAPIAAGGRVELPIGAPPVLDLSFRGERLLLQRDPEVLVRADADLALTGTWQRPSLRGELDLRRSWLTKRIKFLDLQSDGGPPRSERGIPLFSLREAPFRDMELDLDVHSTDSIMLRTNVARGGLRPDLVITGTGEVPRIEGRVILDPTSVSLPGATVMFRGGTLTFEPSDPFVPRLQLVGTCEKFGHDITAVVTGPYDDPSVELSSSPALSSEDIALILLAGRPPTGFQSGTVEATQSVAIYLAQDFASAWLNDGGVGDPGFLERVEVVTGREVSRNGLPTIEIRLRVSDDFAVDGGRIYLSGERDIYEDSNLGVRFALRLR